MFSLFSFSGRSSRKEYWFTFLGIFLFIGLFGDLFIASDVEFLLLILVIPIFAIQIKRCRDAGWSPWWVLCALIPNVNILWLIILGIKGSAYFLSDNYEKPKNENKSNAWDQRNEKNSHEYSDQDKEYNDSEVIKKNRVISCPECDQRLKIYIPLPSEIVRCAACSCRFHLRIDEEGSIYITHVVKEENNNEYGQDPTNDEEDLTIHDAFLILGLSQGTSRDEIKKAYRAKMRDYHPDRVEHLGDKLKEVASQEAKKLNMAYSMLKDEGHA